MENRESSKERVLAVKCPACWAGPDQQCRFVGTRGEGGLLKTECSHEQRFQEASKLPAPIEDAPTQPGDKIAEFYFGAAPESAEPLVTNEQIKHMVGRFLGWKLPENFNPDGGISFKKAINENRPTWPQRNEPVGTNLLSADQAEEMVRYMVEGLRAAPESAEPRIQELPELPDNEGNLTPTGYLGMCIEIRERQLREALATIERLNETVNNLVIKCGEQYRLRILAEASEVERLSPKASEAAPDSMTIPVQMVVTTPLADWQKDRDFYHHTFTGYQNEMQRLQRIIYESQDARAIQKAQDEKEVCAIKEAAKRMEEQLGSPGVPCPLCNDDGYVPMAPSAAPESAEKGLQDENPTVSNLSVESAQFLTAEDLRGVCAELIKQRDEALATIERMKNAPLPHLALTEDGNGNKTHYHAADVDVVIQRLTNRLSEVERLSPKASEESFQRRVEQWCLACFGPVITMDKVERNHRFLEESLELVQAIGCTQSEAHQLVDYVFSRPVGEPSQELGGVVVTLNALATAFPMPVDYCGEKELARVWGKIDKIRQKQAAKPKHSPLPAPPDANQPRKPSDFLTELDRRVAAITASGRCISDTAVRQLKEER